MANEILIKMPDGTWSTIKDGKIISKSASQKIPAQTDLPKGVSRGEYERMEKDARRPAGADSVIQGSSSAPTGASGLQTLPKLPYRTAASPRVMGVNEGSVSHDEHPLRTELEELIDRVVLQSGVTFADTVLQKRFRTLISSRLRDVRDIFEARTILLRDPKVGGIGLREEQSKKVEEQAEKAFGEFQAKWKALEAKKREELKKKQMEEANKREGDKVKKEEQEMEERYRKMTGVKPQIVKSQITQIVKPQIPKAQIPKLQIPFVPSVNPKSVVASKPFVVSVAPKSVVGKITDVRSMPKLLGPVEELSSLTLEDFRRLAGTPQERVQKIIAKIELLQKESIVRRAQGIEAWRKSPLNQEYFQIVHKAMTGRTSPEQVLGLPSQTGKPSLTPDEFHAIMEVNQKLRF